MKNTANEYLYGRFPVQATNTRFQIRFLGFEFDLLLPMNGINPSAEQRKMLLLGEKIIIIIIIPFSIPCVFVGES